MITTCKMRFRLIPFILFFICNSLICLGAKKPVKATVPQWVQELQPDYQKTFNEDEADDGYALLLFDRQVNYSSREYYSHTAKKIVTAAGIENASQLSLDYDPSYESLNLHYIRIVRNGKAIDQLDLSHCKVIQREEALDRNIYDGSLSAVFILNDVRKGDVIEYAYTIAGVNPIFQGHFFSDFSLGYARSISLLNLRLLVPANKTYSIAKLNNAPAPKQSAAGSMQVLQWTLNNTPAIRYEDMLPDEYRPEAYVQISDFASWADMKEWAKTLFPFNEACPAVKAKAQEIKSRYKTQDAQALAAVRFVQDDIRYMGIEMGENSHKPNQPDKVLTQRFGDCKDKSYLLCRLLREMGMEAHPVLISTSSKKTIAYGLPGPGCFDHATVLLRLGGSNIWIDPTISYQGGSLPGLYFPDYQVGLVVTDTSRALTRIAISPVSRKIDEAEEYDLTNEQGDAFLKVVTTYAGGEADDMRYRIANGQKKDLARTFLNYYTHYYPSMKAAQPLEIKDDREANRLQVVEQYVVHHFWDSTEISGNDKIVHFNAGTIGDMLSKPKDMQRKMPLALNWPGIAKQSIKVYLPSEWDITPERGSVINGAFDFRYAYGYSNQTLTLDYEYIAKRASIAAEFIPTYMKDVDEVESSLGYQVSRGNTAFSHTVANTDRPGNNPRTSRMNLTEDVDWRQIIIGLCVLIAVIRTVLRWRQKNTYR